MKFLGWLFIIILCAQALSNLALELSSNTRDTGFGLSKPHMQEQVAHGVNVTTSLHKQAKVYLRKGQNGKGVYGGANIIHRPPHSSEKSAVAPLLKRSPFFMLSTTILCAGFSLVLFSF